jgi:hypothetical protein
VEVVDGCNDKVLEDPRPLLRCNLPLWVCKSKDLTDLAKVGVINLVSRCLHKATDCCPRELRRAVLPSKHAPHNNLIGKCEFAAGLGLVPCPLPYMRDQVAEGELPAVHEVACSLRQRLVLAIPDLLGEVEDDPRVVVLEHVGSLLLSGIRDDRHRDHALIPARRQLACHGVVVPLPLSDSHSELILTPHLQCSRAIASIHQQVVANDHLRDRIPGEDALDEILAHLFAPHEVAILLCDLDGSRCVISGHRLPSSEVGEEALDGAGSVIDVHAGGHSSGTVPLSSEGTDPFLSSKDSTCSGNANPMVDVENGSERVKERQRYTQMPRNTTGGSKHKSQSNSESSKARNNRTIIDDLLDDYRDGSNTDGVFVGRVLRRMGSGRMEVFYVKKEFNEFEGEHGSECTQIIPMRGGLRGRGKKDVWVEPGCLVVLSETGLGQTTHEIVAVFSAAQIARLRKLKPDMNPRFFAEEPGMAKEDEGGIVIEDYSSEGEVDVEDI